MTRIVVDYRTAANKNLVAGAWQELVRVAAMRTTVKIPGSLPVEIRARVEDQYGVHDPGKVIDFTKGFVKDRTAGSTITVPDPKITPKGSAVTVQPESPPGSQFGSNKEDEIEYEVRFATVSTSLKDAELVGIVRGGGQIDVPLIPEEDETKQTIHVLPFRPEGDEPLVPISVDISTSPVADMAKVEDFDDDFTTGTLEQVMDAHEVLESVGGGGVRQVAQYAGDITAFAGDADDIFAGDAGLYWSPGVHTMPEVDMGVVQDFQLQIYAELTSIVRPTMFAGDANMPICLPREQNDGVFFDPRWRERNFRAFGDETPLVIDHEVKIHDGTSYGDYEPVVPGKDYRGQKHTVRNRVYTMFDNLVTLRRIRVLRRIRNLKFEIRKVVAYPSTDGLVEITFATENPLAVFTEVAEATATILDDNDKADVSLVGKVEDLTLTGCKVRVSAHAWERGVLSSGTKTFTFPIAYVATPVVMVGGEDLSGDVNPSAPGLTTVVLNGTGSDPYHATADGIPAVANLFVVLHINGY